MAEDVQPQLQQRSPPQRDAGIWLRSHPMTVRTLDKKSVRTGGAGAQGNRREQRASEAGRTGGGQPPPPPGSTKPRGRASRPQSRGRPGGGGHRRERSEPHGAGKPRAGGGRPTDTLRPPGAAAPRTGAAKRRRPPAVRNKAAAQCKRTGDPNQRGARVLCRTQPEGRARRRMLAAGITAASSAQLCCCASAASSPAPGLHPWAAMSAAAMEPVSAANRRHSEQSHAATPAEGVSPARLPVKGNRAAERGSGANDLRGRGSGGGSPQERAQRAIPAAAASFT